MLGCRVGIVQSASNPQTPFFWWDFSEANTVFKDINSTIAATNDDVIGSIKNRTITGDSSIYKQIRTPSTGVIFKSTGFNNRSYAQFTSGGMLLDPFWPAFKNLLGGSMFIVSRNTKLGDFSMESHPVNMFNGGNNSKWSYVSGVSSAVFEGFGFDARNELSSTNNPVVYQNSFIYSVIADPTTNTKVYRNSTLIYQNTFSTLGLGYQTASSVAFSMGSQSVADLWMDIGEIRIYNFALTESTNPKLSQVMSELHTKWGTNIPIVNYYLFKLSYVPFEDSSGKTTVTNVNNVALDTNQLYGFNVAKFLPPLSNYLSCAAVSPNSLSAPGDFHISFWVRVTFIANNLFFFAIGSGSNQISIHMQANSGNVYLYLGGSYINFGYVLDLNWTYFAISRTGSTLTVHSGQTPGASATLRTTQTSSLNINSGNLPINIGRGSQDNGVTYFYTDGYMADFKYDNTTAISSIIVPSVRIT